MVLFKKNLNLIFHVMHTITFTVTYGLAIKAFYKVSFLNKCPSNFNNAQKLAWELNKSRKFLAFAIILFFYLLKRKSKGAPLVIYGQISSNIGLKELLTINFGGSPTSLLFI